MRNSTDDNRSSDAATVTPAKNNRRENPLDRARELQALQEHSTSKKKRATVTGAGDPASADAITNWKRKYKEQKEKADDLNKAIQIHEKTNKDLEDDLIECQEKCKELKQRNEELQKENEVLEQDKKDLRDEKQKLYESLKSCMIALRDGGKHAKTEQKKDAKKAIERWIKDRGFKWVKFVRDKQLTEFTRRVYLNTKDEIADPDLSEEHFVRVYKSYVQETLSSQRQYTQTQGKKAVESESHIDES